MEDYEKQNRQRYLGKFPGFIRDDQDPDKRGRIRVYCPMVMGELDTKEYWLNWAMPCLPWFAWQGTGLECIPTLKQKDKWGLWIEFVDGDIDYPVYSGIFPITVINKDVIRHEGKKMVLSAKTWFLGNESADQPIVQGLNLKNLLNDLITALQNHIHPTGAGPSGPPSDPSPYTTAISNLPTTQSDWAKTQKAAPTMSDEE